VVQLPALVGPGRSLKKTNPPRSAVGAQHFTGPLGYHQLEVPISACTPGKSQNFGKAMAVLRENRLGTEFIFSFNAKHGVFLKQVMPFFLCLCIHPQSISVEIGWYAYNRGGSTHFQACSIP
jgi:hypothetical protein